MRFSLPRLPARAATLGRPQTGSFASPSRRDAAAPGEAGLTREEMIWISTLNSMRG